MPHLDSSFDTLFRCNMGVTAGERIIVFTDTIRDDESPSERDRDRRTSLLQVARECADFASARYGSTAFITFPATSASGAEPPTPLWESVFGHRIVGELSADGMLEKLLAKKGSPRDLEHARSVVGRYRGDVAQVVIALSNNSTSHTSFRKLACHGGSRFASLPHFDPEMFLTSMRADPVALKRRTTEVARVVNGGVELEVTTPLGTSLVMNMRGRRAEGDDGDLTSPGSFGNLPAGEVYLAPVEGSAEGTMVITHAPTRELVSPLILTVRGGEVVKIDGDDPYRQVLEARFAESRLNRNIAELGIGTNDRASRADNVLEAEKILGTVHVALGDNSGFGGRVTTSFHEDYVLFRPTLTVIRGDGGRVPLLVDGNLLP